MYCSHCKTREGPFVKENKLKSGRQLYNCQPCKSARLKKYRSSQGGKEALRRYKQMVKTRYPEKVSARDAVNKAVQRGKIIKPLACQVCHKDKKKEELHGHHIDYFKKLEVLWVCAPCHREIHRKSNATSEQHSLVALV